MGVLCNATDSHLTSTVALSPGTGDPISITTWMSAIWSTATTTGAKSLVGIYGPNATAPTTAIQIGSRTTNNTVFVWTYGGSVLINSTAGAVADGVNHFIAYTFNGTTHSLYIDGVLNATSTTAQIAGQFNTFYINGYPPGTNSECAAYQVESVRLYSRELSAPEVLTIYSTRGARHNVCYGLLAYFEFDEGGQGTPIATCFDLSGAQTPAPLTWTGTGTPMTYTYSIGEAKLRPVVVN